MKRRNILLGAAFAAAGLFILSRFGDQPDAPPPEPERQLSANTYVLLGQARLRSEPFPGDVQNTLLLLDEGSCVRPYADGWRDDEFLEVQVETTHGVYSGWVTKYVLGRSAGPIENCLSNIINNFIQ